MLQNYPVLQLSMKVAYSSCCRKKAAAQPNVYMKHSKI